MSEQEDFESKSLNELMFFQSDFQRISNHFDPTKNHVENRIIRGEALRKLGIVTRLIQKKWQELDDATKLANAEYMNQAVPENIADVRYCTDYAVYAFECGNWKKPNGRIIEWQRKIGKDVKTFKFDLLTISADKFKTMLSRRFNIETFFVEQQVIRIVVV